MTIGTSVLALASINIEGSKNLSRVAMFLRDHAPEIVCLQELFEDDVAAFRDGLGYEHSIYINMCRMPEPDGPRPIGIGILSRRPFVSTEWISFGGGGSGLDVVDRTSEETRFHTHRYPIALARIALGSNLFTIGTTHFPWTNNAGTTDFQRATCDNFLRLMKSRCLVFMGDFNAPRGGEIFGRLAAAWTDNIPPTYTSSLDRALHRVGHKQLMVDGVFSSTDYVVSSVALHEGVSDHCAVTALIAKR
jgi:endonuclease/exonuclease/phosphatase family metal-dependent hydrolase